VCAKGCCGWVKEKRCPGGLGLQVVKWSSGRGPLQGDGPLARLTHASDLVYIVQKYRSLRWWGRRTLARHGGWLA
jgi:hypothetical protein